jgi:integrase
VEWERIGSNPAAVVRKPPSRRKREVKVLPPGMIEGLRAQFPLRDAVLVSVLAYAGLRPGEALALCWRHIGERTITVEGSVSFGELKETKTNSSRTVRLLAPLARDLAEWRMAQGRPGNDELLFHEPTESPGRATIGTTGVIADSPLRRAGSARVRSCPMTCATPSTRSSSRRASLSSKSPPKRDTRRR